VLFDLTSHQVAAQIRCLARLGLCRRENTVPAALLYSNQISQLSQLIVIGCTVRHSCHRPASTFQSGSVLGKLLHLFCDFVLIWCERSYRVSLASQSAQELLGSAGTPGAVASGHSVGRPCGLETHFGTRSAVPFQPCQSSLPIGSQYGRKCSALLGPIGARFFCDVASVVLPGDPPFVTGPIQYMVTDGWLSIVPRRLVAWR